VRSPEPQYKVLFTSEAKSDVGLLDGSIRKRLEGVLSNKLAADPEGYETPLRGALTGFWKHEFASHRVIYRIYPDMAAIVVCAVGKRQGEHVTDVYKQLEPMVKAGKVAEQIRAVMESAKRKP
jgi:mRNA-degrading endonuclease RelE of RelBE toxin-antitoxin system